MKFFFGLLAFIAAAVVVILLVVSLFRGLNDNNTDAVVSSTYSFDDTTAIDSVVRYRISGPVVADEDHREVRITISKNVRTLEVIKGFNGTVIASKTYENNPEAYRAFLGALTAAEFADNRSSEDDPKSTCVTGDKLYFETSVGSTKTVDSWTSSCSFEHGTFAGNQPGTAQIFRGQIPDYSTLTAGLSLRSL